MNIRRSAASAAVLMAVGIAFAPTTAQAAPSAPAPVEHCPSGWLCGWTNPDFDGVVSPVAVDFPWYPESTAYVGMLDGASVWNNAGTWRKDGQLWGRCATVYNESYYKGKSLVIRPNQGIRLLPASFGHVRSNRFHACRLS